MGELRDRMRDDMRIRNPPDRTHERSISNVAR